MPTVIGKCPIQINKMNLQRQKLKKQGSELLFKDYKITVKYFQCTKGEHKQASKQDQYNCMWTPGEHHREDTAYVKEPNRDPVKVTMSQWKASPEGIVDVVRQKREEKRIQVTGNSKTQSTKEKKRKQSLEVS